jgi:hypothetical protein
MRLPTRSEFWGAVGIGLYIAFAILALGVLIYSQVRPVASSEVCGYLMGLRICEDAGFQESAEATKAVLSVTATTSALQTATAAPVILDRGDVIIERYLDQETGKYIFVCKSSPHHVIPCSTGDK